jgi:hypothetical protein
MYGGQRLGDLLMKFADRSETNVDAENSLGYLLTSPTSHSVEARQMGKQGGEPRPEPGSSLPGQFCPVFCSTRALDTSKLVFGDLRCRLRDVNNLMTPVFAARLVRVRRQRCAAMSARLREDRDDQVGLIGRYQVPVLPFVAGLTTWFALLGLLWRSSLGLGRRSIG